MKKRFLLTFLLAALLPLTVAAQVEPLRRIDAPEPSAGWNDEQRARMEAGIRARIAVFEGEYAALVAKQAASLTAARKAYEAVGGDALDPAVKSAAALQYQDALDSFHWAIFNTDTLQPIRALFQELADTRPLAAPGPDDKSHGYKLWTPWYEQVMRESQAWLDRHVWSRRIAAVVPFATLDRSYLRKPRPRLAVIGDSITDYNRPNLRLPEYLGTQWDIFAGGASGQSFTSYHGGRHWQGVIAFQPDVVVIYLGANGWGSIARPGPKGRDATVAAIEKMIADLRALPSQPQIILTTPAPQYRLTMENPATREMIAQVCRKHGCVFLDFIEKFGREWIHLPIGAFTQHANKQIDRWLAYGDGVHIAAFRVLWDEIPKLLLEPHDWLALQVQCTAVDAADFGERWLLARAIISGEPRNLALLQRRDGAHFYLPWADRQTRTDKRGDGPAEYAPVKQPDTSIKFELPYIVDSPTPPSELRLPASYAVRGRVTRGDGSGVPDLSVRLTNFADGKVLAERRTEARNGSFAFESLSGDVSRFAVVVTPPNSQPSKQKP